MDDAQETGRALDGQTLCSLQLQSRMIHVYGTQSGVHTTMHDRGYALGENQSANPENQQGNPLRLRIVQFFKGPSLSLPDWMAAHSSSGLTGGNPDKDGGDSTSMLERDEMIDEVIVHDDAMTQNRGAKMYDTGAPIYEPDGKEDETRGKEPIVEESVDGFRTLLFWLTSLIVEGRIVWMERWVDMTPSTTKFQSFLMR